MGWEKCAGARQWGLHNIVSVLEATEVYTLKWLKWQTSCYTHTGSCMERASFLSGRVYECSCPGVDPAMVSGSHPGRTPSKFLCCIQTAVFHEASEHNYQEIKFYCYCFEPQICALSYPANQVEKEGGEAYLEVSSPRKLGNTKANRAVVTVRSGYTASSLFLRQRTSQAHPSRTPFRICTTLHV